MFSALLISCGDDNSIKEPTAADIVNSSIIDLPSCISSMAGSRGPESEAGVYEAIRQIIGGTETCRFCFVLMTPAETDELQKSQEWSKPKAESGNTAFGIH